MASNPTVTADIREQTRAEIRGAYGPQLFLSRKQVAELLGKSVKALEADAWRDRGPVFVKRGKGQVVYPIDQLIEYVVAVSEGREAEYGRKRHDAVRPQAA